MYGRRHSAPLAWVGAVPGAVAVAPPYQPFATLPLGYAQQPSWSALMVPPEPLDEPTLEILCDALTRLDVNFLAVHPRAPRLYESGVRYQAWPNTEFWLSVPWALAFRDAGLGVDCKTLAAWRAAELRVRDGDRGARCVFTRHVAGAQVVYHVRVQKTDGSIEDPSALLGMDQVMPGRPQLRLLRGGR